MCGSATFVTVTSSTCMMVTSITAAVMVHLRAADSGASAVGASACAGADGPPSDLPRPGPCSRTSRYESMRSDAPTQQRSDPRSSIEYPPRHETELGLRDAAAGGRRPRGDRGDHRAVRAGRPHGLRHRVVRGAPLPHQLLDVAVPGGDLRRAEPPDQADPARLRRGDPALPPSGAGGRAGGDGRSPVRRARGVRHRTLGGLRADGHGDRSAQHARDVGRVAADDPARLGGRAVLVGGAVLERPAA